MAQTNCVMQLCRGKDSAKKGYTKMSGAMARMQSIIAQHSLTQQEFARQKSTKTRSSHMCHSTIQQSQGFSLDRCPLAPVTTQNHCSHIQLCKGLGGISWQ